MKAKMRRHFAGSFRCTEIGSGTWMLVQGNPQELQIIVRGAQSADMSPLGSEVSGLSVEWLADAVCLSMSAHGRPASLQTDSAIVHEPLRGLYEQLPLAEFDDKARRFWRRVFALVRMPGGRFLLKYLA